MNEEKESEFCQAFLYRRGTNKASKTTALSRVKFYIKLGFSNKVHLKYVCINKKLNK